MFDKHYVGLDITGSENNGRLRPISRVTLLVDDNSAITAGDDTGLELTADCPFATQEMANAILAQVKGYQYQMYSADEANIDPAAELGDGVTVGGVYSVISRIDDDGSGYAGLSAPGEAELEDEFPIAGPTTQAFTRKIAETRSYITKTAGEIRLEVSNELEGLSAFIDIQLDSITSQVTGLNGQVSTLTQTASSLQSQITSANGDISVLQQTAVSLQSQITNTSGSVSSLEQTVGSITLSVSNSTASSTISLMVDGVAVSSKTIRFTGDVVFESDLANGTTTVSGDCITTGRILASYIKLGGKLAVYQTLNSNSIGGYLGFVSSYDYDGAQTTGMGMMVQDSDGDAMGTVICTTGGARLNYQEASEILAARYVWLKSQWGVKIDADEFTSPVSLTVTSDRRAKEEILYDLPSKYIPVLDALKPASFRIIREKNKTRHMGLIAQEVEEAMAAAGVKSEDFGLLCIDEDGNYGLRYEEFIPLLIAKVQQIDNRLKEMEA